MEEIGIEVIFARAGFATLGYGKGRGLQIPLERVMGEFRADVVFTRARFATLRAIK
jgi:hypothetical protein